MSFLRSAATLCLAMALTGCATHGFQNLSGTQRQQAHRIESVLNAPDGFEGEFVQTGSRTGDGGGRFQYSPGVLHLIYTSPHAMDLKAQNGHLVLDDRITGAVTRLNLARNPLGLLLHRPVRFTGDILVTDVHIQAGATQLSLAEANNPSQGLLTLQFIETDGALRLVGLDGVDARQNRVTLHLYNVTASGHVSDHASGTISNSASGDSPKN